VIGLAAAMAVSVGCSRTEPPKAEIAGEAADPAAKSPAAPLPEAPPVTLAAGTPITIRTTTVLSTDSHQGGERFVGHLEEPLLVGERLVAPKGAQVEGVVVDAAKGGRVKGRAEIAVRLTKLETAAGPAQISTNTVSRQAPTTKRDDAVKVGIGSGVGAAIGAIAGGGKGAAIGAASGAGAGTGYVLATRGAAAVIPAEAVLHFKLTAPVALGPLPAPGARR
jgi:hypothetical protein